MDDVLDWSDGEDEQISQQETRQVSVPRSEGPSGSADPEDAEDCISLGDEDEEQDYDFQRVEDIPRANEVNIGASPPRSRSPDDSNNRPQSPAPIAEKPEPIPQRSRGSPAKKKQDQVSPTRTTVVPPPRPTHALPAKPVASALRILAPSHPSHVEARSMTTTRNRSESEAIKASFTSPDKPITTGDKTAPISEIPPSQEALPPGWETRQPRNGEGVYYYNTLTEESTWKRPSFIGSLTATHDTRNRDDKRRNGRATSPARRRRNDPGVEEPISSRHARMPMEYPAASQPGDSDIPSYEERHYRPEDARSRSTMVPTAETTDRRGEYYRDDALPLPRTDPDYMPPISPSAPPARARYERELTPPPPPGRDVHPLPHQGRGGRYHTTDGDYRDDREIYPPSHREAWAPESRQDSQHPQYLPSSEQTASERLPLQRKLSTRERNRGGDDFHHSADTRGRDIPAQSTGSPPRRDSQFSRPRVSQNGPGNAEHRGPDPRTLPVGHRKKSRFEPSPVVPPPPPPPAAMLMRRLATPQIDDDPNLVPEEFLHEPAPDESRHYEEVSVVVEGPHDQAPTPFSVTPSQVSDQDYQGSQEDRLSPGNIEEPHSQMPRRRAPLPSQTASFRGSSGPQSRGGSRRLTQSPSGSVAQTQSTDNQSFADDASDYHGQSQSMMFVDQPSSTRGPEGREHRPANLSVDGTVAVSNQMGELSVSRRSPGLPARPQETNAEGKQGRGKETRRGAPPKKNENDRATGNGRKNRRERGRPQLSLTNSIPVSNRRTATNGTPSQASSVDPPYVRDGGVREAPSEAIPIETRQPGGARSYDPPEQQPIRSPVSARQSLPQNKSPGALRVDPQIRADPNELASSQPRIWTPRGEEPPPEFRQTFGNENLATTPPSISRTTSMNSPTSQRGLTHRRYSDSSRHLEPPPPLHHPPMSDHLDPRQEHGYSNEPSPRYTSRSPVLSRPSPVEYETRDGYLRPPHPELPRRSSVDYGPPVYPHDMRWEGAREEPPPRIPQTRHDHYDMVDEDRTYIPAYAAPLPLPPPPHPHHEHMPVEDTYFPEYPHDYAQDRTYDRRPEMGRNPSLLDRISMDDDTSLQDRIHIPSKRDRDDYSREARDERHNGLAQDPISKRQRRRPNNGGGGRSRRGDRRGGGLEV